MKITKFLQITLATNFMNILKNNIFASIRKQNFHLPPTARLAVLGSIFFAMTLPVTNYRFRKSMNLPVTSKNLYQAFGPTVLRDIIYGSVRKKVLVLLTNLHPTLGSTVMGRVVSMYATVVTAWVVSSPLNELRGYYLQPQDRKQSFASFFQPAKCMRNASASAIILAISLGLRRCATSALLKCPKKLACTTAGTAMSLVLTARMFYQPYQAGR